MTNVVIVVENGMIQEVYCRNKNVEVEVLDLDTQDEDELKERIKRTRQIENAKSYKKLL